MVMMIFLFFLLLLILFSILGMFFIGVIFNNYCWCCFMRMFVMLKCDDFSEDCEEIVCFFGVWNYICIRLGKVWGVFFFGI